MSLRLRLMLWNVGILAFALIALGGILRVRVQYHLQQGIDHELETRAHASRRWERFRAGRERGEGPREQGRERMRPPSDPSAIYSPTGRNLFTGKPAPDATALKQALQSVGPVKTTHGNLRVYSLALRASETGRAEAVFQVSASLDSVQQELAKLTRELLALLPIGLLVAGIGGLFLTSRALRPIQAVTDAAAQIEASDLSRRLDVPGKDELGRLAMTFNTMLGRLEDSFERQRRFTADASHELKTPLTTIKMTAGFGLTDPSTGDTSKALFARIDRAADRTILLVQNLLMLARSDASALGLAKERVRIADLFQTVAQEMQTLFSEGPTLNLEVHGECVMGDPLPLEQVLFNLLDNALRHTPPEGTVTLSALPNGFRVTDTGTGIAPEHLPHLTERFYRADAARARRTGGTGLGLAICKSLIEAHGGTLTIQSARGEGTRVTVELP